VNPGPRNGISGNDARASGNGLNGYSATLNNPNLGLLLPADDPLSLPGAIQYTF
jgi:hypothetical protein